MAEAGALRQICFDIGFGSVALPLLLRETDRDRDILMPKAEWGVKRTCLACRVRFYDLARTPIICPKCGEELDISVPVKPKRARPGAAAKIAAEAAVKKAAELIDDEDVVDDVEEEDIEGEDANIAVDPDDDDDDDDDAVVVVKSAGKDDDDDSAQVIDEDVLLDDATDDDDDDDLDDIADAKPGKPKDG